MEGKPAHESPCANSDCVLSFCINDKLRQILKSTKNQGDTKRREYGSGFKNPLPVIPNMEMAVGAEKNWDQGLADVFNMEMAVGAEKNWDQGLADVFNIPSEDGQENFDGPSTHPTEKKNDNSWWSCPGQEFPDFQLINPNELSRCWEELPNLHLPLIQSIDSSLLTKVKSNSLHNDNMPIGHIDLNDGVRIVPKSTITGDNTHLNRKLNPSYTSYGMGCAVPEIEPSLCDAKRSVKNQSRQKPGNSFAIKRRSREPQKSTKQLFGVLSLVLQAFDGPLTSELEERYISVLQRALSEIENIRQTFLQH